MSTTENTTARFVAIGYAVYDRVLNRFTGFASLPELRYDLDALNTHGDVVVGDYQWEDAK